MRLVYRSYLPSKKILILIGVILIGAAIIYTVANRPFSDNEAALTAAVEEKQGLEILDSDNDGLSDWEESLWGTDLKNPDTDGDGTSDGDEVAVNRDPNDASSDDSLRVATENEAAADNETNATTRVRDKVLPQALALVSAQQEGEEITNDDINRLASSLEEDINISFITYSQADLQITTDTSTDNIQTYVVNLLAALEPQTRNQRDPLSVIAIELQSNNRERLDLTAYISQIQKAEESLLNISVPQAYASDHLDIINSLAKSRAALKAMERVMLDPVTGIAGVQLYRESAEGGEAAGVRIAERINQDLQ